MRAVLICRERAILFHTELLNHSRNECVGEGHQWVSPRLVVVDMWSEWLL